MKTALISIIVFTIFVVGYFLLRPFHSAFEADQACHYQIIQASSNDLVLYCDHDTETRQWLLYEKDLKNKPAKVINRFRY